MGLLYQRDGVPSIFKYPDDGLLPLRNILTAQQIIHPDNKSLEGDLVRHAIKRGFTTNTTVGTLTRFMSFVRKYFNVESLEVPILSYEHNSGTFSGGGDSGSIIVSATGEFVELLTGWTNSGTNGSASPSLFSSSRFGSSSRRSSPVPICTLTTLKNSSPTWARFVSFSSFFILIVPRN